MAFSDWEAVIGLEIHVQLDTKSKIFSSDPTNFGAGDNENVSPVSLGLPGSLPVLNKKALEMGVRTGLALNCEINKTSFFARKNYFYPDLSKGYQISQSSVPVCGKGFVDIQSDGEIKRINIDRAHLEEDAGKSTHHGQYSLINYNRAGVPLLEIVSAPEIYSAKDAAEYARTIRKIVRYLEVCDGNLEEGSMRCDCNVSIRKVGDKNLGTRVELKNINSFRFIEKALSYEIERQVDLLDQGQKIVQETRLYDSTKNKTQTMRSKEEAEDYRYFPDPDLLPIEVTEEHINEMRLALPELPFQAQTRFEKEFGLNHEESHFLTEELEVVRYFDEAVQGSKNPKSICHWIMGELWSKLNDSEFEIDNCPIKPKFLNELVDLVEVGTISGKQAKKVFAESWSTSKSPKTIVNESGMQQITDKSKIGEIIDLVLEKNKSQVDEYKSGKTKVIGYLVGQIMKESKGTASPEIVNNILREKLK